MVYRILLFNLILLHTSNCFSTSERHIEHYSDDTENDKEDYSTTVKPMTSAKYEVKEEVDDIPDYRPLPGPVIPNHAVDKPLNFAQSTTPKPDVNETENNSGNKKKHSHKHKNKKEKENGKEKSDIDDDEFSDFIPDDDFDENGDETGAGFYESVKEALSEFKNGVWNSLNNFFGRSSHSFY